MRKACLVLLFLWPSICSASILDTDIKQEILDDFSGGLNTNQAPHKLNKNQSPNIRNWLIDEQIGSLVMRNGYITAGSTPTLSKITGMWAFQKSDGTKQLIVSDSSQVLATSDFTTLNIVKQRLNTNVNLSCIQINDKMFCSNG